MQKTWNRIKPDLDYTNIEMMAGKAKPFYAFIDPDDNHFFNPENMPAAIYVFLKTIGQPAVDENDIRMIGRIVYESLALKYRYVFERIRRTINKRINTIHIIGGGSKNNLLNTFVAAASHTRVLAGPFEGTAMGNLLMQAYGCGDLSSIGEIRRIVAASSKITVVHPTNEAEWQAGV